MAVPQQTWSAQWVLEHSPSTVQDCPLALTATHVPLPLQVVVPLQTGMLLGSGWPSAMFAQVPRLPAMLHAWQVPQEALPQQTPSTQWALEHWPSTEQDCPSALTATHVPLPLQTFVPVQGVALLESGSPMLTLLQVPLLAARLHALQVPVQSESQHTSSAQWPFAHSFPPMQSLPRVFFSTHCPPLQKAVGAHCASMVQLVRQAVPEQRKFPQLWVPLTQVPVPLQAPARVRVEPLHDAALHAVPLAYFSQAPLPLQKPSVPQVDAFWKRHSLSGSDPAPIFPQTPSLPAPFLVAEHASQRPPQPVLQQTPSTQLPLVHSFPPAQTSPLIFFGAQLDIRQ
jgi:hypothetical protein